MLLCDSPRTPAQELLKPALSNYLTANHAAYCRGLDKNRYHILPYLIQPQYRMPQICFKMISRIIAACLPPTGLAWAPYFAIPGLVLMVDLSCWLWSQFSPINGSAFWPVSRDYLPDVVDYLTQQRTPRSYVGVCFIRGGHEAWSMYSRQ